MTVSSSTNRVSYSGNGTLTAFAYTFKIFDEDDLTVILRASDGTETVQTITTHYTVSGVGDVGGGNVTFVTAPTATQTVVILREQPLTQGLDLVPNDPFPANSLEEALDKIVFMTQKHEEELGRAIKASRTNTITGAEFTISASDRANKIFAFDNSGDVSITQAIGTFKGDWAASTSYVVRDIVKDTNNNNIYIANTAHTSSGSVPLTSNADIAKWDLLVDAASATTSATNAAASETAAETAQTAAEAAQTAAETAQTAAETAETNAETAQTAAEAAQSAAETAYDNFDDRYLGAKASDPTLDNDGDALINGALYFNTTSGMKVYDGSSWDDVKPTTAEQTNIDTVAGVSANVTTVAGISSDVTSAASVSSDITTVAGQISPTNNISTLAGISANITTVANNVSGVNSFAERYRVDSSDPTTSLDAGDLAFNTTSSLLKYYDGSSWQSVSSGIGSVADDATPQLGGALDTNGNNINFADNDKAIFGAGSDLQIYHDGTHSYISDQGTGNLRILGANISLTNPAGNENYIIMYENGAVEIAYDDVVKIATTSLGVDVNGEIIADSYNETYAAVTSSSNATTVNCHNGNAFSHTLTENTTFTFSNPPASGTSYSFSIEIIQDASASGFTVTWPAATDWPSATAPTLTATASAKDVFVFYTRDGGTNWYGFTAGQALG